MLGPEDVERIRTEERDITYQVGIGALAGVAGIGGIVYGAVKKEWEVFAAGAVALIGGAEILRRGFYRANNSEASRVMRGEE